jgi:prophage DNA circulation protein
MSGSILSATSINLYAGGDSFLSLLQMAYFRGIPFKVQAAQTIKGRKVAVHDYPFRDGGWAEDLGRAQRIYSFTGYIIGDLAPAMQLLLDNAAEAKGPGLLIHPTIGAVRVTCLSCATSVRKDAMRVIEVQWRFLEQGETIFPTALIATAVQVLTYAATAISAIGESLGRTAGPAAATGASAQGESVAVANSYAAKASGAAADPAALVSMAAGLPVTMPGEYFGRYGAGNTKAALPDGTTVASLQGQLAAQRGAVVASAAITASAAGGLSPSTAGALAAALAAMTEAARATMTDPADQVRVMLRLAVFGYADNSGGIGLGGIMATVRNAVSAAARRVALVSLAMASAAYQPASYEDAHRLRDMVADAIEVEMLAAADNGEDAAYGALKSLRVAVIQDLTTRGATLPTVITVRTASPLPSLVLAYRLYGDASRAEQLANAARAPHPAFLPTSIQALAA